MLARAGLLAFLLLVAGWGYGPATARAAGGTPLVEFVSSKEISFPLASDGLAVAPARFPFLVVSGTDPADLDAAVIVTTRAGNTSNLPALAATIVGPTGHDRLYTLQIQVDDASKALEAGRYDITVLLWPMSLFAVLASV